MYTKTLHTKDDIKQREESPKHPDFLFTHKQETEVFQKTSPYKELPQSSGFSALKICLRLDELLKKICMYVWIKTKFIRVVILNKTLVSDFLV